MMNSPHPESDRRGAVARFFAISEELRPVALGRISFGEVGRVIEHAPLGIMVLDDQIRIRRLNAIARPIVGQNVGDVIGKPWLEVLKAHWPPDIAESVIALARRTLETGIPHSSLDFSEVRVDLERQEHYHWDVQRVTFPGGLHALVCYFVGPLPPRS